MRFDSTAAIFRQLKSLSGLSRVLSLPLPLPPPPPLVPRRIFRNARAYVESSIMNQRSSSIERCFAYGALMDDLVALINKATTIE